MDVQISFIRCKNNILVKEKIEEKLNLRIVKIFLKELKDKIPIITITTNHKPYYRNIMDELNINHQLCIFHFKKEINTKIKKIKRKKQVLKEDLDKINRYKDLIFQIVDSKTYNDSKKLYKKLLSEINEIPMFFKKNYHEKICFQL